MRAALVVLACLAVEIPRGDVELLGAIGAGTEKRVRERRPLSFGLYNRACSSSPFLLVQRQ